VKSFAVKYATGQSEERTEQDHNLIVEFRKRREATRQTSLLHFLNFPSSNPSIRRMPFAWAKARADGVNVPLVITHPSSAL